MAFMSAIPSQLAGVEYLNFVDTLLKCDVYVGGHSKGGNIAVYSAAFCDSEIEKRIIKIYNHDGPGFKKEIMENKGFSKIEGRIEKIVPHSSIIGMILCEQENYKVIESTRFFVMQHDPFSWVCDGVEFKYLNQLASSSHYTNMVINKWLNSLSDYERREFIDTLYEIFSTAQAETFNDMMLNWKNTVACVFNATRSTEKEKRDFLLKTIKSLISYSNASLITGLHDLLPKTDSKFLK